MAETIHWLVYAQNGMHGTKRLVESGLLSEEAADERCAAFRKDKQIPEHHHKADYFTLSYVKGTRNKVMEENGIAH